MGCAFSVIEDNHIHHICSKQELGGAELGGIKLHAAIDVILRRNHIHHCVRGLWLDWQAQGTRVTGNLFHDNVPPADAEVNDNLGEDILLEVSHGPTLIDNNLLLSEFACRFCSHGIALVHNLIAGSFTFVGEGTEDGTKRFPSPRCTPYHVPHRTELAGLMTILHGDARFYHNIFVQKPIREDIMAYTNGDIWCGPGKFQFVCGTKPYNGYPTAEAYFRQFSAENAGLEDAYYDHLPVYTGGNAYFNGAQPCDVEQDAFVDEVHLVFLKLEEKDGRWTLHTNLYQYLQTRELPVIDTAFLGEAFEPEQPFEQPDGSPVVFDRDYFGISFGESPLCGPFADRMEHIALQREHAKKGEPTNG